MADHREFHSEFQLDHFVIGAAGHPWAQYQQALRELAMRYEALKAEQIEIERAELDRDDALNEAGGGCKYAALDARAAALKLDGLNRKHEDRKREFAHVWAVASALREKFKGISPQQRAHLDHAAWYHRLKARAAIEAQIGGLSAETLESIHMLPRTDRVFVLECLRDEEGIRKLISWHDESTGDPIEIADFLPSADEVKRVAGC